MPKLSPKLRILVTNDDGIEAPGLKTLEEIAAELSADVWVVAPETEQSGAGHSLTLHEPLRVKKLGERRYAVSGTPTDCVLLAAKYIIRLEEKNAAPFTLLLSGVNRGSNLAEDVTYSGTIAAAMEGTLLDIPSIALSQCAPGEGQDIRFDTAQTHAPRLIRQLVAAGWPENVLINLNFPNCAPDKVKGVKFAPHGRRKIGEKLIERHDPKGRPYIWIGSEREAQGNFHGSDIAAIREGNISVTPLNLDLTDYKVLEQLREKVEE